jgi:DNA-directed RNA polymerase specialized sigma24 family protein
MDDVDDAAIIARSSEEPELFATVFDRHFSQIRVFLQRRIGEDADDLAADVFSIAFQRRDRFQAVHRSALPWLYGIASNLVAPSAVGDPHATRARPASERGAGRGGVGARRGASPRVLAAPSALRSAREAPSRDRDALLLVAWEELTYEEVAVALEKPVGTVRSRLNRARHLIRTTIAGDDGEAPTQARRLMGGLDV